MPHAAVWVYRLQTAGGKIKNYQSSLLLHGMAHRETLLECGVTGDESVIGLLFKEVPKSHSKDTPRF